MSTLVYRFSCSAVGCGYLHHWQSAHRTPGNYVRCSRCQSRVKIELTDDGVVATLQPNGNIRVQEIKTLDEALALRRNAKVTFTPQQAEALEKIWATAEKLGVQGALFDALMYIGGYALGARFITVEDGSTPDRMSMEFVGLGADGNGFIHIGAIYRPDEKNWSFHS